ncbi:MAG: cysteine--tRNA ligase [Verrucomicrobiota bacterium]
MDFVLSNTLTSEKERVFASDAKSLRFYCCGPTVYGPAHIGNFRTFVLQDVFRRVVELSGLDTVHVRNITDVDDKTIRESRALNESLTGFTDRWRERFEADCSRLGILPPHHAPSAVAHIQQQIDLIQRLIEAGHAYQAEDGSVYYRVSSFEPYGRLSGLDKAKAVKNADGRMQASDEYAKDDWADFALWKAWKEEDGPNQWESLWGPGRPGWHIECSAMSMELLGESFDLHSGGVDLIFPHHENEIAQSEGATGKKFVRHWFHVAHLMVNGEKMSKSLGNLYTLDDLAEKGFQAAEVRFVLASGHYRKTLNFTFDSLNGARKSLNRVKVVVEELLKATGLDALPDYEASRRLGSGSLGIFQPAWEALLDDLNTAESLGRFFGSLRTVEAALKEPGIDVPTAEQWLNGIAFLLNAMGLFLPHEVEFDIPEEITDLANERLEARNEKDWGRSDSLRDELLSKGWQIKDAKEGYELTPVSGS